MIFALAAAVVASAFFVELVASHLRRPRPHVAAWSVAIGMYAVATWALFGGTIGGWTEIEFRTFYLLGAILNVPFLGLGSAYLGLGTRVGAVLLVVFAAFGAGAGAITLGAELTGPLPESGVPAGSELFADLSAGLESPRLWAVVGNAAGSLLVVVVAVWSLWRQRNNRALLVGNLLVIGGILAPVAGGLLTAFGEAGGLALSLLVGAGLLWAGFRKASRARRQPTTVMGTA